VRRRSSYPILSMVPEVAKGDFIQIVRGILSNIARHARASQVWVACGVTDEHTIVMTIEDDGIGFDPATVQRGDGLSNIEERAERLDGKITISKRTPKRDRAHSVHPD
jgi:signal transduction histidine kinase